jgi:hypothetical protein
MKTPSERLARLRGHANQTQARSLARALCAKHRLPVPAWAVKVDASEHTRRSWATRRKGGQVTAARTKARRTPAATPAASAACEAVSIPSGLSAWRAAAPGRAVHVCRSGVVLDELGQPQRHYPTIAQALLAIESPDA